MHRKIAISLVAFAFVVAVQSDNVQKCYMCTSLTNDGCGSELIPSLVEPTECTENNMIIWQGQIKQHNVLNSIVWLFEISEPRQHYEGAQDIACLKMTLNVANQNVTIRTCQTAKTEFIDPCKTMERQLEKNQRVKMNKCDLCLTDACNNTTTMSPDLLYILLSFFGYLIHITFYRLA